MLGGFGPELAKRTAGEEVALKVEGVLEGGLDRKEALRRAGRFEPLHLPLAPAYRLA